VKTSLSTQINESQRSLQEQIRIVNKYAAEASAAAQKPRTVRDEKQQAEMNEMKQKMAKNAERV
jgi:hypothetical protein